MATGVVSDRTVKGMHTLEPSARFPTQLPAHRPRAISLGWGLVFSGVSGQAGERLEDTGRGPSQVTITLSASQQLLVSGPQTWPSEE